MQEYNSSEDKSISLLVVGVDEDVDIIYTTIEVWDGKRTHHCPFAPISRQVLEAWCADKEQSLYYSNTLPDLTTFIKMWEHGDRLPFNHEPEVIVHLIWDNTMSIIRQGLVDEREMMEQMLHPDLPNFLILPCIFPMKKGANASKMLDHDGTAVEYDNGKFDDKEI